MKWEEWDKQQTNTGPVQVNDFDVEKFWHKLEPHVDVINTEIKQKRFWLFSWAAGTVMVLMLLAFWGFSTHWENLSLTKEEKEETAKMIEIPNGNAIAEQQDFQNEPDAVIINQEEPLVNIDKKQTNKNNRSEQYVTISSAQNTVFERTVSDNISTDEIVVLDGRSFEPDSPSNISTEFIAPLKTLDITINTAQNVKPNGLQNTNLLPRLPLGKIALDSLPPIAKLQPILQERTNWRISFHQHFGAVQKTFSAKGGGQSTIHAQNREKIERARFFNQQEIRLQYHATKRFFFQFGISRTKIRERVLFDNSAVGIINDFTIEDKTLVYQPGTNIQNSLEHLWVGNSVYNKDEFKVYNHYRFIDFSIGIGFENTWKKLLYNVYTGVYLSQEVTGRGAIYLSPGHFGSLAHSGHVDVNSVLNSKANWSPYIGVQLAYPVRDRLNLIMGVHHRFGPLRVLQISGLERVDHSIFLYSIQAGFSYNFSTVDKKS